MKKILRKIEKSSIKIVKAFSRKRYNTLFYSYVKRLGVNLVGTPRFIEDDVYFDPVDYTKITVEKDVTISRNVTFLIHDYSVSQPFMMHDKNVWGGVLLKPIHLKKGCFIGANTILLPGTTIGENTIVGAGSVVKGEIPDNVVIAGTPARVIKSVEEYYLKMKDTESRNIKLWKREGE